MANNSIEERLATLYQKRDHIHQFYDADLKTIIDAIRDAREHGGSGDIDITTEQIEGGTRVTITDADGTEHSFDVKDGDDAYEVYKSIVPSGETPMSKTEWLASLKGDNGEDGAKGDTGATGPAGPQGIQGKSAFEVWKETTNRPTATEAEYIADLQTKVAKWIPVAYEALSPAPSIGDTVTFTSAPNNPIEGAIVLMPNAGSSATATMMFAVSSDGQIPATYTYTYIGDMDNVDVTGLLGSGDVDGTHLANPAPNALAKAADVKDKIDKTVDLTSDVTWGSGYIKPDGSLGTSSLPYLSVGNIDVTDYRKVTFKYSCASSSGSSASKLGYVVKDSQGNVLLASQTYNPSVAATEVTINLPSSSATLYISWDTGSSAAKKVIAHNSIDDLFKYVNDNNNLPDDVEELQDELVAVGVIADKTSSAALGTGYYIDSNGIKTSTTLTYNGVYSIALNGVKHITFNYSIAVAATSRVCVGYSILNSRGGVVAKSTTYSASPVGPINVDIDVPNGGELIIISWDLSKTGFKAKVRYGGFGDVYNAIGNIQNEIDSNNPEYNLTDVRVQSYLDVQYDNSDYYYTNIAYATINGTQVIKLPLGVAITTPIDNSATTRHIIYADNNRFIGSKTVSIDTTSETITLYNLIPQKRYWYKVYKDSDVSKLLNQGTFLTKGTLRDLQIDADEENNPYHYEHIDNVRDVGGWSTDSGSIIRYGVLVRGYALNGMDGGVEKTYLSQDGIDELKDIIGIRAELDLRSEVDFTESVLGQDVAYARIVTGMITRAINPYAKQGFEEDRICNAIRQIISWLQDKRPVYIHCTGGCDRTGGLCAIIEGLCGVSENQINKDYELSQRKRNDEYYSISNNANAADGDFRYMMEYIKGLRMYNGTAYTKCRCYKNSYIVVSSETYNRDLTVGSGKGCVTVNGTIYYAWKHGSTTYYTIDKYPSASSVLYEESGGVYSASEAVISSVAHEFWYDTTATVTDYMPVPISDSSIITALEKTQVPSLKDRFAILMQLGDNGLTNNEIETLRNLILS